MKILLVEDEKRLASSLKKGLGELGHAVDIGGDGEEGLHLAESGDYDAIVLDVSLPKMDGFTLLESLRRQSVRTPVIFLTARGSLDDRVKGLNLGADDYLPKPFAFSELVARLQAVHRRKTGTEPVLLKAGDLELNLVTRAVTRAGRRIELRPKEFALLQFFLENRGRVLTRSILMERVWDYAFATESNVIDVHVKRLREKIDGPGEERLIRTVKGVGYSVD